MKFEAAAISEVGPRRVNEDKLAYWTPAPGTLIAAIADGLGGMGGGSTASEIAVETLRRKLDCAPISTSQLEAATEQAHADVVTAQKASTMLRNMATTLTAGVFSQRGLIGVHCGDTRASIARGNGIKKLTRDHSEGERLYRAGKLTKDELRDYPRKNVLDSALGVHDRPKIDTFEFDLIPCDKVFFTTDGVHGKLFLRELRDIANQHDSAQRCVAEIAEVVKSRSPEDNFSILAVFVH